MVNRQNLYKFCRCYITKLARIHVTQFTEIPLHYPTWMRKQPLLAFYTLAFSISWLGWIPQAAHSRGLFPFDSPIFLCAGRCWTAARGLYHVEGFTGQGRLWKGFPPALAVARWGDLVFRGTICVSCHVACHALSKRRLEN